MKKISIIGAGHVGGEAAFFCAQKELGDIFLIDIKEGLAKGKALDQNQALGLMGINPLIKGSESLDNIAGSDIVLITCGIARKTGMSREDLLKTNLSILKDVSLKIKELAPESIVIIITNPVDILSYACMKYTEFPRERVFGQAGVLDSSRFAYQISASLNVSPAGIQTMVLGGHGDSMVPVSEHTTVGGIPLADLLSQQETEYLIEKTRKGGAEIVAHLKDSSAYYAPALSAVLMIESIVNNKKRLFPCSVYTEGEYGLEGLFIGLPVILSRKGMEKIICMKLSPEREQELKNSFAFYKSQIESITL